MKNWIIVLLIFVVPLALYAFLDAKAQSDMMCKVEGNAAVKNPKLKVMKFTSPMCSECKEAQKELDTALKNVQNPVVVEEINVVENVGKGVEYNKAAIKKFKVSVVPTFVFVNKEGTVVKKREGLMKSEEIIEVIDGVK